MKLKLFWKTLDKTASPSCLIYIKKSNNHNILLLYFLFFLLFPSHFIFLSFLLFPPRFFHPPVRLLASCSRVPATSSLQQASAIGRLCPHPHLRLHCSRQCPAVLPQPGTSTPVADHLALLTASRRPPIAGPTSHPHLPVAPPHRFPLCPPRWWRSQSRRSPKEGRSIW